jgi:hypothetical protein
MSHINVWNGFLIVSDQCLILWNVMLSQWVNIDTTVYQLTGRMVINTAVRTSNITQY